jgi:hypothetical protein
MALFVPPDVQQVDWMLAEDATTSYLDFLTYAYDLLCIYVIGEGLPYGALPGQSLKECADRNADLVRHFELHAKSQTGPEYRSINNDINRNKMTASGLYLRLDSLPSVQPDPDAEEFLRTLRDAYAYVTSRMKQARVASSARP